MSRRRLVARNLSRGRPLAERLEDGSSFWARFMGLMGRSHLAPGEGLWLPSAGSIHMLFMRFSIDAVFVGGISSGRRRVLAVRRALPPWRGVVWFVAGAHGVLELPAGTIDRSGTAVGDEVLIEPG